MHDYYRALDRETALWRPDEMRSPAKPLPGSPAFDTVETKWVDPNGSIGSLIAVIEGVDYSFDLVRTVTLHPSQDQAPQTEEEAMAYEGAIIEELPEAVRDVLAGVPDERFPEIARRWAVEPLSSFSESDAEELVPLVKELVELARRAKAGGELLYCWWFPG